MFLYQIFRKKRSDSFSYKISIRLNRSLYHLTKHNSINNKFKSIVLQIIIYKVFKKNRPNRDNEPWIWKKILNIAKKMLERKNITSFIIVMVLIDTIFWKFVPYLLNWAVIKKKPHN